MRTTSAMKADPVVATGPTRRLHASVMRIVVVSASTLAIAPNVVGACDGPHEVRDATLASIKAFVNGRKMKVLTFTGYSGAGYEDPKAMLQSAAPILDGR